MPFLGRAQYNLFHQQQKKEGFVSLDSWKTTDYRALSIEELLTGLLTLGIEANADDFEAYAAEVDSPEDLAEALSKSMPQSRERIYLYCFELWRRLLDDRETISIFCDEFDHLMSEYEEGEGKDWEMIHSMFLELVDILDSNVDRGEKPKKVFELVSSYFARDLESFLYNFIFDQDEKGNKTVASELLGNFSAYISHNLWFDFLNIRLLSGATTEDATAMMARFLERLGEKPDLELYFSLLRYLIEIGDTELFSTTYRKVLDSIKSEEQFVEMLDILFEYFNLNDLEEEENSLKELIEERKEIPLTHTLSLADKRKLKQFVEPV